MSIDIEQLLALIAARPKIRTVEIAEILDCSSSDVLLALQRHVDIGTIAAHRITAPNGDSIHEFEMFVQAPILTTAERAAERAAALRNTPGVDIDKAMTRIDRAIAFIAAHDGATDGQLHGVMGLPHGRTVSSSLRTAIADGRLARDGARWIVGPGKDGIKPAAKAAPAAQSVPEAPIMAGPVLHIGAMPVPDPFRCALWSDGSIELRRDGQQLALLTTIEQTTLLQLMRQVAR